MTGIQGVSSRLFSDRLVTGARGSACSARLVSWLSLALLSLFVHILPCFKTPATDLTICRQLWFFPSPEDKHCVADVSVWVMELSSLAPFVDLLQVVGSCASQSLLEKGRAIYLEQCSQSAGWQNASAGSTHCSVDRNVMHLFVEWTHTGPS